MGAVIRGVAAGATIVALTWLVADGTLTAFTAVQFRTTLPVSPALKVICVVSAPDVIVPPSIVHMKLHFDWLGTDAV